MNFYFGTKMKIWIFVGYISCTLCEVIVQTKLGAVKGTWMQSRDGKRFNAFMAVPYAKPPIGELRFRVKQIKFFKKLVIEYKNIRTHRYIEDSKTEKSILNSKYLFMKF